MTECFLIMKNEMTTKEANNNSMVDSRVSSNDKADISGRYKRGLTM